MGEGLLNSYAQVFFSKDKLLAVLLLLVSFFDLGAGISGVLAILVCQVTALTFSFNQESIRDGYYTYNALLVGVGLGIFYEFNLSYVLLLLIASILTLFLTIWISSFLYRSGLPVLSIPFLLGVWCIILSTQNFTALELSAKSTYSLGSAWPQLFEAVTAGLGKLPFHNAVYLYLRSLGAIFFQYNDLAGLLIAIGLIRFSRMAFTLSVFGFAVGYVFFVFFEGDFSQLIYPYIGFNFLLTSIALGGFFVVPSRKSFLLLIFTIPVIALMISAFHILFSAVNLPMYSLPFNIVVLMFLATMATRYRSSGVELVQIQHYSPEQNHYRHFHALKRFARNSWFQLQLPVMGWWNISQGHEGDITHKDDWKHAWDFDIRDEEGKTYRMPGIEMSDYYCYELPVMAPAAGTVVEVLDQIDDNKVGDSDLSNNWGNTVIIQHGEAFYSKLSHLKKGSIPVKKGEYVAKGQLIGKCGNSGRSPEPHLHFQLQATPYIGSKTLSYPIAHYLVRSADSLELKEYDYPEEGEIVSNILPDAQIGKAFGLLPGQRLAFDWEGQNQEWEVLVNSLNQAYIYCHTSGATAYFTNDGTVFSFTAFYGSRKSLLFHFHLAAQKVLLGYHPGLAIEDSLLTQALFPSWLHGLHDFAAPFFHFLHGEFRAAFESASNDDGGRTYSSVAKALLGKKQFDEFNYRLHISDGRIDRLQITHKSSQTTAVCVSE